MKDRSWLFLLASLISLLSPLSATCQTSTPPFHQCPAVGADSGCAILIIITNDGISVATDPSQGPFDQIEDTLVGVQNNSTQTVFSLPLSAVLPIFAFDGDGLCAFIPCTWPHPTNYEGQTSDGDAVSFSDINPGFTSGIVHFANGIGPNKSAFFSLEERIQTLCRPLNVQPVVKQFASPWGPHTYDNAPLWVKPGQHTTIAAWGCNLTSAVMLINYQAEQQQNAFRATPDDLNEWLEANSQHYKSAGDVFGPDIQKYVLQRTQGTLKVFYHGASSGRDDFTLDSYLCTNNPIILEVPNGFDSKGNPKFHFVLATGQTVVGAVNTFAINDPGYAEIDLSRKYGFRYLSLREYSSSPSPLSVLSILGHSPIEFVLTDPAGKRTGFDPASGSTFKEVSSSSYLTDSIADDDAPGSDDTSPPVKSIEVLSPLSGIYNLQVVGTGQGPYTIDFEAHDSNGDPHIQTVQGNAIPGSTAHFTVGYSPLPGAPVAVAQIVTVESTIADINAAQNAGLIEAELATDLIRKLNKASEEIARRSGRRAVNILNELQEKISDEVGEDIQSDAALLLSDDLRVLISTLTGPTSQD